MTPSPAGHDYAHNIIPLEAIYTAESGSGSDVERVYGRPTWNAQHGHEGYQYTCAKQHTCKRIADGTRRAGANPFHQLLPYERGGGIQTN